MTLEQQDKISLSEIRMEKAQEFLGDAKANYNEKRYKTSINRSYYAALNAIRAILILDGVNPETHEGIVTMLSLRFIKPKILPVEIVRQFKILFSKRTDVDYGDFETIDEKDAEDAIKIADKIIKSVDKTRKKMTL